MGEGYNLEHWSPFVSNILITGALDNKVGVKLHTISFSICTIKYNVCTLYQLSNIATDNFSTDIYDIIIIQCIRCHRLSRVMIIKMSA